MTSRRSVPASSMSRPRGGFDVVLGNPPWVRQELLGPVKPLLKKFRSFASSADSSVYFLELAAMVCRSGGRVAMLTPNKWFRAAYAKQLRAVLIELCRVDLIIDFGHSRSLFPDADTFPAAITLEPWDGPISERDGARFVNAHDPQREAYGLTSLVQGHMVKVPAEALNPSRWNLENRSASDLLRRFLATGQPLETQVDTPILSGLKTGLNSAFYVSSETMDALTHSEPQSRPLFRRFLRGRDVGRWHATWKGQWHIVIASSQNVTWPWSNADSAYKAEQDFAATHPLVYEHLKQYEVPLKARQDKGVYWWELRSCDYYEVFEAPKIVVQCIAYYSQFAFDSGGLYVNNKVLVVPSDDLFLLAVLNSRITWWIINRTFQHMKDDGLSVDVQFLRKLPVPQASENVRKAVATRVRHLIEGVDAAGGDEAKARLEHEVNDLIESAFGLTDNERSILLESLPLRDPLAEYQTSADAGIVQEFSEASTPDEQPSWTLASEQDPANLPDLSWQGPATRTAGDVLIALAAVLKAVKEPRSVAGIRMAALLILEPRLLTPFLTAEEAKHWQRLVGDAAKALPKGMMPLFPIERRAWQQAVDQHIAHKRLVEDLTDDTWGPGESLRTYVTAGWAEGRAVMAIRVAERVTIEVLVDRLKEQGEVQASRWVLEGQAA